MATVRELTDPNLSNYMTVPRSGPTICSVCHGVTGGPGFADCYSCAVTRGQVSWPVDSLISISLCEAHSQLHHVLRGYKDGHETARPTLRLQVAAIIARFFAKHAKCIEGAYGEWSTITSVPSSKRTSHPLEHALSIAPGVRDQYRALLAPGQVVRKLQATDKGFTVIADVSGLDVVLIDDTFTSGASVQSAASALTIAGANVVTAVTVGRYIIPDFSEYTQAVCDWSRAIPYDFTKCAICGPDFTPP